MSILGSFPSFISFAACVAIFVNLGRKKEVKIPTFLNYFISTLTAIEVLFTAQSITYLCFHGQPNNECDVLAINFFSLGCAALLCHSASTTPVSPAARMLSLLFSTFPQSLSVMDVISGVFSTLLLAAILEQVIGTSYLKELLNSVMKSLESHDDIDDDTIKVTHLRRQKRHLQRECNELKEKLKAEQNAREISEKQKRLLKENLKTLQSISQNYKPAKYKECAVCFSKPRNSLLMPCRHQMCCFECAEQLTECPICKGACEALLIYCS